MPTYEYRCNACEHEFELFQSMSDKVKRKCPECGAGALERLIGLGAGVIFKGSGFYETDYRSESYKKGAEAEKKSSDKGDSKGSEAKCACGSKPASECASGGEAKSNAKGAKKAKSGKD